jgi:8-oxo-dGTP pyrophosphatase MutT (NUDIX family)
MIKGTKSCEPPLELPKGRPNAGETKLETAIREVREETGLPQDRMNILWHLKPYIETFHDCGETYKNTYYFAEVRDWNPQNNFSSDINYEVADVKWVTVPYLQQLCRYDSSYKKILKTISKVTKKYRNHKNKYVFL